MLKASFGAAAHPLWMCGFRPFFLATALSGAAWIAIWGVFLGAGLPLPAVAGGPFVLHAHEMIFGFGLAAVAGFVLTAIPEFTGSASVAPRPVRLLAGLWLVGRAAFWSSGSLGAPALAVSGVAHVGLVAGLVVVLAPRLWNDPERRHLSFLWALLALGALVAGFYVDALTGAPPARWLHAALGVLMILIVVSMSRISMSIVNAALDELGGDAATNEYRARPPKRNLAIACIAAFTAAEFFVPASRIGGWLALAVAAALLHVQSDWHVGRVLLRRWVAMLFGVYVLMAAGYAAIGAALLSGIGAPSAGLHLLAIGALGLGVYAVLNIAGPTHCGRERDESLWMPAGALLVAAAALLRGAAALLGDAALAAMVAASICWVLPFAAYAWRMGPTLMSQRTDGATGCEGVVETATPATPIRSSPAACSPHRG
jgi:uncharacterized protein involved in response to NO